MHTIISITNATGKFFHQNLGTITTRKLEAEEMTPSDYEVGCWFSAEVDWGVAVLPRGLRKIFSPLPATFVTIASRPRPKEWQTPFPLWVEVGRWQGQVDKTPCPAPTRVGRRWVCDRVGADVFSCACGMF